ncbi:Lactonase, 7-bladed beta-propeller-domain-containing protein [Crepidotus variabilis]|uniref:Lactonase, 7-bladed beta-propeller-domain-containing protein n=1 Tax=Crepidotus variabilis TaxID=179855 RepID=A0A9P6JJP8_9AGAR|nr:Lactonase, 7-bladed beta-propeller-domain-containing protein [Crepidotus variabilis]
MKFTILAGGHGAFISTYIFDDEKNTLILAHNSPTGPSPTWLALDPKNRNHLYAVNEATDGALQVFKVTKEGHLSAPLDTISSGGDSPAYAAVLSNRAVGIVNFSSGTGRIIPTSSDGTKFDTTAGTINFPSQENVSHPHQVVELNDELLIPDLGEDTIWRLVKASDGEYTIRGSIPQPEGSGPRHIAVHNDRLFVLHELSSTLSLSPLPSSFSTSPEVLQTVSIIPLNAPPNSEWHAGEILIPPSSDNFPSNAYIYVSNRNVGSEEGRRSLAAKGDPIAIFEHLNKGLTNERLVLVTHVDTGLDQVRAMKFSPGGEYLVAAGMTGKGGVVVFKRTERGRNLVEVARNSENETSLSFVWL